MPRSRRRPSASPGPPAEGLPRRQWAGSLSLALLVSLTFAVGLGLFYGRARQTLDEAMGQRLQHIASTAAASVPGDSLLVWWLAPQTPLGVLSLTRSLQRAEMDNDLSRIVVYQSDQSVLLDTSHFLRAGEKDPFLALDLGAVEQARAGLASFTRLQEVAGSYLKAGYAPVFDSYGDVAGFVGVMASPSFFTTLRDLRRALLATGLGVVATVALLTSLYLGYARRLARARRALERGETLAAMGRMAAGIAHEIRNPLGIIKNTAQLLKEELDGRGVESGLLDFIPQEVDRLNTTLTGYLDFAKDAPCRLEPMELGRVLRRTLKLLERDFENAGVRTLDNLDELGELPMQGDPRRLQQVFLNLFLNAIQAMPDGGTLDLRALREGPDLQITVQDTGTGLEPEDAEQVFEPFFTRKERGSGLGLSVVRRIVDDHGGSIRMEGRPGEGARVLLRLPVQGAVRQ